MKPKHFCSAALCCILILLSACNKDDNDNPLRFYNDTYEVPMGGIRYLGLESGNGDYSLEVEDQRLISAQVEHGWSTPGGSAIYVRGILTGKTTLKVTDAATLESCLLKISRQLRSNATISQARIFTVGGWNRRDTTRHFGYVSHQ